MKKNIVAIILLLFIYSCSSQDNTALTKFKEGNESDINACIGATGTASWKIFDPAGDEFDEFPDLRVIEVTMKKLNKEVKEITIQYKINSKTLAYDPMPSAIVVDGEPKSLLLGGMDFLIFCEISFY